MRVYFSPYYSPFLRNKIPYSPLKPWKPNAVLSDAGVSVVACTCNPATLEAEFWSSVGSIAVGGNSLSIGGWIEWPPVIQL